MTPGGARAMPDAPIDREALPTSPAVRDMYGQAAGFAGRGDWASAGRLILRLREVAPDSIPVLLLASQVLLSLGHYCDARALALQAANAPIRAPELLLQAVRCLRHFEEPQSLDRLLASSRWQDSRSPQLLSELALHAGSSGLYGLASDCLDLVLQLAPRHADAHYLRGLFEMFSGNVEASRAALRRALSIEPRMANTHWLLSMQEEPGSAEAHVEQMLGILPSVRLRSEAQAYLFYSLHHSLAAAGRHDQAWQALERGHAVMRSMVPYRRDEQHALFAALKAMRLPASAPRGQAANGAGLIFIVGMFRSGTTLIERVLAGHHDVTDGGETYQLSACLREAADHPGSQVVDATIVARAPTLDFARVAQRMQAYADWRAGGKRWLTEKLPSNFLNVGFILQALPEARILHMRRDPVDTCFSNLRTISRGVAPYACDQRDLADYYLQYRDLMAHWHALAPGRILDIDYADFVADPGPQARRVMEYCGLDFVPETIRLDRQGGTAATASAAHVRMGILGNRGNAWKPYADALQPLIKSLQPG